MNKIVIAAAAAALMLAPAAAANETFDIALPQGFGEFSKQTQTVKAGEGTIEATNYIAKAPSGEAVVVTVSKMPGKILDPDKLISSTRDSLLKSLNATLESEEKLAGELPAVRLLFRSQGALMRSRLMVDEDRLIQVLYVGRSDEQRAAPAVAQLFESFSVTK